jgi:hypothetical protein
MNGANRRMEIMGEFTDVVVLDFYILTVISGRTAMRATCRLTHLHNFRIAENRSAAAVLPRLRLPTTLLVR